MKSTKILTDPEIKRKENPIQKFGIQRKIKIGKSDDTSEQEADNVADRVMRMPENEEETVNMQPQEDEEKVSQISKQSESEEEDTSTIKMQSEEEKEIAMQPEEEEEPINMKPIIQKSTNEKEYASREIDQKINSTKGSGKPLPKALNREIGSKIGANFNRVRIHTDNTAVEMSTDLGAQAFTHGNDVFFNRGKYDPGSSGGKQLLAHELVHVVQQNNAKKIQCRPINRAERRAAIAYARARFDEMSVRIIQNIAGLAGANIDGDFGRNTAQAVSDYQTANGIAPDDGLVHQNSLDEMIANRVAANRRNEAIHLVSDFYDLDITTDTLSVFSQPGVTRVNPAPPPANFPADTDFESGGLRVIRVGNAAFTDADTLRDTIQRELNRVAPVAAGPAVPHGGLLSRRQVRRAISYMNRHYQDRRSIMALQGQFVGVNPTGIVDEDLVQRIADVQNATPTLAQVDGMVGRNTLEHFFVQLRDSGNQNAAMRLVMDFYDMPDYDNLLTIYYQDFGGYTGYAGTRRSPRVPVRVRVRRALYQPFPAVVHTLRHELEHVGQHRRGILSRFTREFLSEASEVISAGMPHETLFDVSTVDTSGTGLMNVSGFQNDVVRMMDNWDHIPTPAEQRRYWRTFVRARRVIRRRIARTFGPTRAADQAEWAAATPAQQAALTALLTRVNAVARP